MSPLARVTRTNRTNHPAPSDCCSGPCFYQPAIVGMLRFIRDRALALADEAPSDAYDLLDAVQDGTGDAADHERERWACVLADLARAEGGGRVTDADIAAFLCGRGWPRGRAAR